MPRYKEDVFIGNEFENSLGEVAKIVSVEGPRKILIEWETDRRNQNYTTMTQLRKGHFKNPYTPSVWNVGYIGVGEFSPKNSNEAYLAWQGVMQRCFDEKLHIKYPSYSNKTISPKWHCFQDFVPWFKEETVNKPDGSDSWAVDKDILRSNEYGPDTCFVVPKEINLLILNNKANRGDLPIGVNLRKETGKYRARSQNGTGTPKALGDWDTVEEAFLAYKMFKEAYIKQVADKYRGVISERAYNALVNYEVKLED